MSTVSSHGYVLIYVGKKHPMADVRGYAYEHRIIAAKKAGRMLSPIEIVHHRDENRKNNSDENIILEPSIAHHKLHHRKYGKNRVPGEENSIIKCQCGCNKSMLHYDKTGRPRIFIAGHSRKGTGKRNSKETIYCRCGCGNKICKYDKNGRERIYISGHNMRRSDI